jgi:hypothetical protein
MCYSYKYNPHDHGVYKEIDADPVIEVTNTQHLCEQMEGRMIDKVCEERMYSPIPTLLSPSSKPLKAFHTLLNPSKTWHTRRLASEGLKAGNLTENLFTLSKFPISSFGHSNRTSMVMSK